MALAVTEAGERRLGPAMLNGLLCRCPRCGKGKLFSRFLKVTDTCSECGEELFHHRADDLPPYIAITIVGHILVIGMLHMEMGESAVNPLFYLYTVVPMAIILPLLMLQPIKGAIVGMQWGARMFGFDGAHRDHASPKA